MKLSIKWLKDHIDFNISAESLAHKLTMAGLETEDIYKQGTDTILELEVTPNRADCLNMVGIAREVSAILNKKRKAIAIKKIKLPTKTIDITIDDKTACPRYLGLVIQGVKVQPAEKRITDRLASVGIRAVSNIVDITNFCLMETGQPMHAFDYDKIEGGKVVVRRAKKGEKITTLDGVERTLDPDVLVIADAKKPVAIAGIMGGKNSEVTDKTKNILLESAYFDSVLIRRTSRKLGLSSDSSYRFERGVDFQMVEKALWQATTLILNAAGGQTTSFKEVKGGVSKQKEKKIRISLTEVNDIIGGSLTKTQCVNILKKLDFKILTSKQDVLDIMVPAFRKDVSEGVDIVEEIARIIGYDNLPMSLPNVSPGKILPLKKNAVLANIKDVLRAQEVNEAITFSLINQQVIEQVLGDQQKVVKITNPLSLDQEVMRPSMLPSLLNVLQFNLNHFQKNVRLFEVGKIYQPNSEQASLGIIITGDRREDWREERQANCDFYDLKGVVESVAMIAGIKDLEVRKSEKNYFDKKIQAELYVGNQSLGFLGKVSKKILKQWSVDQEEVYFAEIDLEVVYRSAQLQKEFNVVTDFPGVTRDVSLAVSKTSLFSDIRQTAFDKGGKILKEVYFKEEYLGEKIEKGLRGLVFSLIYQSNQRTLTEKEVSTIHQDVLDAFVKKHNAIIR